jgi:hypothetical protein
MIGPAIHQPPQQPLPGLVFRNPDIAIQYQNLLNLLLSDGVVRPNTRPLTIRNLLGFVRKMCGPTTNPLTARISWSVTQAVERYHQLYGSIQCSPVVVRTHARWMNQWLGTTISSSMLQNCLPPVKCDVSCRQPKHYFSVDEVQRLYASTALDPTGFDRLMLLLLFTTGLQPEEFCKGLPTLLRC